MNRDFANLGIRTSLLGLSLTSVLVLAAPVHAATLCVNQHNKPGCLKTISAAVAAAAPGDTIKVDSGTYKEDVVIGKSLSLVGEDHNTTFIDAAGLANGVYVDGWDNNGLSDVIVTGFTIENANFEGVLVNNAGAITIFGNIVRGNDRNLQPANAACTSLPIFETSEGSDCGEGIHLMGTEHSVVSDNLVEQNAGGILISDETTTSHDNVVERNLVENNLYGSGITLSSHPAYLNPAAPVTGTPTVAYGNYNNNIFENDSIHNGFGGSGGGAGVALFAPNASERTYANSVVGNRLIGNSMPGIAIHDDANFSATAAKNPGGPANPDVSRNSIVGNYIAGNGPDPAASTTVSTGIAIFGLTPIVDMVITNNFIEDEEIAIATNTAATLEIHLNDFAGRHVGIDNLNVNATVNARENWWGCTGGPGAGGCSTVAGTGSAMVVASPSLTRPMDGSFGHGFDRFFDFFHDYDFDCIRDYDFGRFQY
jgi:parallel beta-helix repeat protein